MKEETESIVRQLNEHIAVLNQQSQQLRELVERLDAKLGDEDHG